MTAVLLGIAAALSWGLADFAARFTGRAVGPTLATLARQNGRLVVVAAFTVASVLGLCNRLPRENRYSRQHIARVLEYTPDKREAALRVLNG